MGKQWKQWQTLFSWAPKSLQMVTTTMKLKDACYLEESHSLICVQSSRPHGLHSPRNSPAQNTGVGSRSLLQGIFPSQELNPGLLHCRWILYQLSHQECPLGRKAMTNLDRVWKSRNITLPTQVHIVNAMVFPVVMYRCESWTVKKAEHWTIDAFELWCWRSWESLGLQGDPTSQSLRKSVLNIHWKDRCWSWNSNTLST